MIVIFDTFHDLALGVIFLEFCCIKLGCYLLNIQGDGAVIDLVAYSGYKFVGYADLQP